MRSGSNTSRWLHQGSFTFPQSVIDDIANRLRAGEYIVDVARATGVSEYTVRRVANIQKIKPASCPPGARWGKEKARKEALRTSQPAERNWRAEASNARWVPLGWSRW